MLTHKKRTIIETDYYYNDRKRIDQRPKVLYIDLNLISQSKIKTD